MKRFKIARAFLFILLFLLIFPVILYLYLAKNNPRKVIYGISFSNKYAQELNLDWKKTFDTIVDQVPTNKYRLVVYWDEVQKNPNSYDYSNIKYQLEKLDKYPDSEVILNIGRKVIRYPECHEPKWWQEIREDKDRKIALMKYVEQTVKELKNYKSIKYWQVENEALFPFGQCTSLTDLPDLLRDEANLVRKLDPTRKIVIQDSGEGGFWVPSAITGDYLGISMYRKVWFDFFGILSVNNSFPVKYPLGPVFYRMKAFILGINPDKIKITEVQAEPWGPVRNYLLRDDEVNLTMSQQDFNNVFEYTKSSGFDEFYLWGIEWWYHMKELHKNSFYWDTAISKFKQ